MCVIAIKPIGVELPTAERLEKMWRSNADGAGVAYVYEGKVYMEKGFMTKEDFDKKWEELQEGFDLKNMLVGIHMRVKTAGAVEPSKCHPFPVSDSDDILNSLKYEGNRVIFHNGTISNYKEFGTDVLSDSQNFIKKVLSPIQDLDADWFDNAHWATIAEKVIGKSRIVVLNEDETFRLFGEGWIHEEGDGGIWYSNEFYEKERKKKVVTTYSNNYYGNSYYGNDYNHYGSNNNGSYKKMSSIMKDERLVYKVTKVDGKEVLNELKDDFVGVICVDANEKYYIYSDKTSDYVLRDDIVVKRVNGTVFKYMVSSSLLKKYRNK